MTDHDDRPGLPPMSEALLTVILHRLDALIAAEPDPLISEALSRRAMEHAYRYTWQAGDPADPTDGGTILFDFSPLRIYPFHLLREGGTPPN